MCGDNNDAKQQTEIGNSCNEAVEKPDCEPCLPPDSCSFFCGLQL